MRDEELQLTTREARKTLSAAVESASAVLDQLTLETYKEQMASLDAAIAMGKEALEAASAWRLQYTGMMQDAERGRRLFRLCGHTGV